MHRAPLHLNWQISTWGFICQTLAWIEPVRPSSRHSWVVAALLREAAPAVPGVVLPAGPVMALERAGGSFMGQTKSRLSLFFPCSSMSPVLGVLLPSHTIVLIDI